MFIVLLGCWCADFEGVYFFTIVFFQGSHKSWTSHSSARLLFTTLLVHAGPVVGTLLQDIIPMFTVCLNPEKDPELRLE